MTVGAVFVTGATGFLGAELVRALRVGDGAPEQIRCLVRSPARAAALGLRPQELLLGDLGDAEVLARGVAGARVVFHLAGTLKASRPGDYFAVNEAGTARLVAAVAQHAPDAHFVLVSSLAAAGPSVDGAGTDLPPDRCRPVSAYGESKRRGELAVTSSSLRWSILRPPVVYGPGDAATRLLFRQACAPLCVAPPRPAPLSAIHVRDAVAAIVAAARVRPHAAVLPLDGPERTDTHALLRTIALSAGRKARLLRVPLPFVAALAAACDGWARLSGRASFFNGDKVRELRAAGWVADGAAVRRSLGCEPRIGLHAGFAEIAAAEGWRRGG